MCIVIGICLEIHSSQLLFIAKHTVSIRTVIAVPFQRRRPCKNNVVYHSIFATRSNLHNHITRQHLCGFTRVYGIRKTYDVGHRVTKKSLIHNFFRPRSPPQCGCSHLIKTVRLVYIVKCHVLPPIIIHRSLNVSTLFATQGFSQSHSEMRLTPFVSFHLLSAHPFRKTHRHHSAKRLQTVAVVAKCLQLP